MEQDKLPGADPGQCGSDREVFERVWRRVMPEDRPDCPFRLYGEEEQAGIVYANLRRTGRKPYQNDLFKQFDCASDWSFRGLLCFAVLTFSLVGFASGYMQQRR